MCAMILIKFLTQKPADSHHPTIPIFGFIFFSASIILIYGRYLVLKQLFSSLFVYCVILFLLLLLVLYLPFYCFYCLGFMCISFCRMYFFFIQLPESSPFFMFLLIILPVVFKIKLNKNLCVGLQHNSFLFKYDRCFGENGQF